MYLVLLISWLRLPSLGDGPLLDLIEFYSGKARLSKIAHFKGLQARAYDIDYHKPKPGHKSRFSGRAQRSHFDMNGVTGFVTLWLQQQETLRFGEGSLSQPWMLGMGLRF